MQVSLKDRPIQEFEPLSNLNSRFFRFQRVTASTGYNSATFQAFRPEPDLMLYSYVPIFWRYVTQKIRLPATPINFLSIDRIYKKPWGMTNAMTTIDVSYNGHKTSYPNPRHWGKYVHSTESTRRLMNSKFSVCGGQFPDFTGSFTPLGDFNGAQDNGLYPSFNAAFTDYNGVIGISNVANFASLEPLMVGLHSPYEQKHQLQPNSRYRRIGWAIPHIKQFKVDVKFDQIPANTLVPMFLQKDAAAGQVELIDTPEVQDLQATMILTWFTPSAGYIIPREVSMPSWYLEHFEFQLNDGDILLNQETTTIRTRQMPLRQVPNAVLLFASNVKVGPIYNCRALNSLDGAAGNQDTALSDGPQELNLTFDSLTIRVDINNVTVDNDFTKLEMYRITEKNCNEMPYDFTGWVGGRRLLASTPGATFMYLTAEDLNIQLSSGVRKRNFNLQVEATMGSREGYSFSEDNPFLGVVPQHSYDLHVFFFFDNYRYILRKDGYTTSEFLTHIL